MTTFIVQQKIISWQTVTVEADSVEQAIELAVDQDDWKDALESEEAVDVYWVKTYGSTDGATYVYGFDGNLEEMN